MSQPNIRPSIPTQPQETSAPTQPHTLDGARVEYIGTNFAWYGHQLTVTHRAIVDGKPRYVLTDDRGIRSISNVSPADISHANDAVTATWTRRFRTITEYATDTHNTEYGQEIAEILQYISRDVAIRQYARAQRHLLDLEYYLQMIDSNTYQAGLAELTKIHGVTD